MPFTVGLTGGIASGKSTVGRLFRSLGVPLIDADQVARQVVEPGQPALTRILEHFGPEAIQADGSLNRAWLRERIFSNAEAKTWLEGLLHPLIHGTIRAWLEKQQAPYVILESPLLLEGSQRQLVDRVLVVDVPENVQYERALKRDGCSPETVKAIIHAQSSRDFRRAQADDIIENTGNLEQLEDAVKKLHETYIKLSHTHS
ncbi:MAG: dephospho-CoA kinase [Gammaproteobacteria bacterium]|nr:MAG: dephospho-CoA kinase [Gammaproteobacteria bacterium]